MTSRDWTSPPRVRAGETVTSSSGTGTRWGSATGNLSSSLACCSVLEGRGHSARGRARTAVREGRTWSPSRAATEGRWRCGSFAPHPGRARTPRSRAAGPWNGRARRPLHPRPGSGRRAARDPCSAVAARRCPRRPRGPAAARRAGFLRAADAVVLARARAVRGPLAAVAGRGAREGRGRRRRHALPHAARPLRAARRPAAERHPGGVQRRARLRMDLNRLARHGGSVEAFVLASNNTLMLEDLVADVAAAGPERTVEDGCCSRPWGTRSG